MKLLTENRDILDEIAKVLIEEEKIDGKQLLNIIKNIKPELISEEAMEAVSKLMQPKADGEDQQAQPATASWVINLELSFNIFEIYFESKLHIL